LARYRGAVCKICRREGIKLFLKGERCFGPSCALDRRNYAPGQHGQARRKYSGYRLQLREKQKARMMSGMMERQFALYFKRAENMKGLTGENLLILLETRLDNIVYKLGFASSRAQARQLVLHGHILINGRKVNIPSYRVEVGQRISIKEKTKKAQVIKGALEKAEERGIPAYLKFDKDNLTGELDRMPQRDEVSIPVHEQSIVELYSK